MRTILFVALAILFTVCKADNWAVLVAGSDGYYNYRHQSDVCHAFQVLKKKGIPEKNIIVFMKDDIANNAQNPNKGKIINIDGGENVYPGVPKDYTGNNVTPQNFLNVLLGKDMKGIGSGKTLKSTSEDNVFVFFSDHGAPGLVAFPGMKMLYAKDLIPVLKQASEAKRFKQMVFYLEACESGSMFNKLLSDKWRIYATTASNPFESSYACDYNSGEGAYLNDCYSFNFINDTEHYDVKSRNMNEQFDAIKRQTTQSHVCKYGDLSIASQSVGAFQGGKQSNGLFNRKPATGVKAVPKVGISSRKVKEDWLIRQISGANDMYEKNYFERELAEHKRDQATAEAIFGAFSNVFSLHNVRAEREMMLNDASDRCTAQNAVDAGCIKDGVQAYEKACGSFNEASIEYVAYIRDACDSGINGVVMGEQFTKTCSAMNMFHQ